MTLSVLSDPEALADIREADAAYAQGDVLRGVEPFAASARGVGKPLRGDLAGTAETPTVRVDVRAGLLAAAVAGCWIA